eukprot:SAG22_NODE_21240_length_258_cov_2.377358_1_plen_59_part_01
MSALLRLAALGMLGAGAGQQPRPAAVGLGPEVQVAANELLQTGRAAEAEAVYAAALSGV